MKSTNSQQIHEKMSNVLSQQRNVSIKIPYHPGRMPMIKKIIIINAGEDKGETGLFFTPDKNVN
jgi:hypothetical protein